LAHKIVAQSDNLTNPELMYSHARTSALCPGTLASTDG
jgi:hypothetical protein